MDFHPPSGPDNNESGKDGKEKIPLELRLIARGVNTHLPFTLVGAKFFSSCVPDRLSCSICDHIGLHNPIGMNIELWFRMIHKLCFILMSQRYFVSFSIVL